MSLRVGHLKKKREQTLCRISTRTVDCYQGSPLRQTKPLLYRKSRVLFILLPLGESRAVETKEDQRDFTRFEMPFGPSNRHATLGKIINHLISTRGLLDTVRNHRHCIQAYHLIDFTLLCLIGLKLFLHFYSFWLGLGQNKPVYPTWTRNYIANTRGCGTWPGNVSALQLATHYNLIP